MKRYVKIQNQFFRKTKSDGSYDDSYILRQSVLSLTASGYRLRFLQNMTFWMLIEMFNVWSGSIHTMDLISGNNCLLHVYGKLDFLAFLALIETFLVIYLFIF